jgi:SPP1 gp7 family putative phage head morphogenesis protein
MNNSVDHIYEIVSSGMLNHIPMEDIVNDIKKELGKTSENIITETNSIVDGLVNDAILATAEKNKMLLKYSDMMDSRVCGKCKKYRDKVYRHDSKDIPLIPQHPHCRCHWILIPDDGKTYDSKDDIKFSDYYKTLNEKEKKIRVGQSKYIGEKSGVYKLKDYEYPVLGAGLSLGEVADRDKKMLTITG